MQFAGGPYIMLKFCEIEEQSFRKISDPILQKLHQNEVILLHVKRRNRVFIARFCKKKFKQELAGEFHTRVCYTKRFQRQTRKLHC